jgi:type I restriction enzyme M protein
MAEPLGVEGRMGGAYYGLEQSVKKLERLPALSLMRMIAGCLVNALDFSDKICKNIFLSFLPHRSAVDAITQNLSLEQGQHVKPEEKARQKIDQLLLDAGWEVQDYNDLNLGASLGVAVREFPVSTGYADYMLFFDRKPASKTPWTQKLWINDLRTNMHFTLKENPLSLGDLQEFIKCYNPSNRHKRKETDSFHSFTYDELLKRDKVNLDISWIKDESLEDAENLPEPSVLAAEIIENLEAALDQYRGVVESFNP